MTKSILRYFLTILVVTLLISCLLSSMFISNRILESTKQDMLYSLKLIDYALDYDQDLESQIDKLNPLAYSKETRISIIDKKGQVIADTYNQEISANHLDRVEVQEALNDHVGYATRKSDTTKQNLLYVTYYNDTYILRLSIPYDGLLHNVPALIPGLSISALLSFVVAYILSCQLAYRISKPMVEISDSLDHMSDDFRFDLNDYEYQEFNKIVDIIRNLSHRLRKSMKEVQLEKTKIDEILKQMNEGFVLLDEENRVLSINSRAIHILGNIRIKDRIFDYLYYPDLIDALESDLENQEVEIKMNDSIYACYISRIDLGTTLLFVDVTTQKKSEKMRREFFSNVSHELKTPMTSIKGYSDLLAQGYIHDEKQKEIMLNKIQSEVNNMSTLINDILMLSRLENMDVKVEMMPLKMKDIVEEVLESYDVEILKHDIHIHKDFEDVSYIGNHQQIYTLLNNLIGNAIKYNKDQGDVYIDVIAIKNAIKISVKDTGIGIPLVDQGRVFERFYRVDKGRSKQRGGTGLGLAIVKHIVLKYKGTIHLESEIEKGTKIDVILPLQELTQ